MPTPKTTTGSNAPKYTKYKIEDRKCIDKMVKLDDAAKKAMAELEKEINALEIKGQQIFVDNTNAINKLIADQLGKHPDKIVPVSFDSDLGLLIVRDKTTAELNADIDKKAVAKAAAKRAARGAKKSK